MASGEQAFANHFQNIGTQSQKTKGIGHSRTGFAYLLGGILLGQAVFLHQGLVTQGFFHGVQVLALEIFNQCQLHGLFIIGFDDHSRNLPQVCQSCGTPAAFTGDDLVITAGGFPDGQGLDHTVDPDGFRQGGQFLFVKVLTGLVGVGFYLVNGKHLVGALFNGFFGKVAKQRTQTFAKAFLYCHCVSSFYSFFLISSAIAL